MIDQLQQWDELFRHWATNLGWPLEGFIRLTLAAAAGGLVGLEREVRGRQAGFRTNLLVCLGSCMVMMVSVRFAYSDWPDRPGLLTVDPGRIAYGVMTGIGFLGAGTIIQMGGSVRGLTTAAALWCVAAIGLSMGLGLYLLAGFTTILIVTALWVLDYVEALIPKVRYRTVTVRRKWAVGCIADTVARFRAARLEVIDVTFERTADLTYADISVRIALINPRKYFEFERQIETDQEYILLSTRET